MPVQSQSQVQGRVSLPAGSPQQAQAANPQQFEMEMYEALVEALELAKTQKSAEELKGKYTELLNNLLTNTPYTRCTSHVTVNEKRIEKEIFQTHLFQGTNHAGSEPGF